MNRYGTIIRTVKSFLVEVLGLGGTTQNRLISPKGLYSKPKNEKAIIINLANSRNQDIVMALQKDIELEDGDVYITDDLSYLHFHFADGNITLQTKKLIYNVEEFELNAGKLNVNNCDVSFAGGSIKQDGVTIDNTHTHEQNSGDHFGAGATTTAPNN